MVLQTPLALMCPAGLSRHWPTQQALPILGPGHWVLSLRSLEDEKQAVKSLLQAVQAVTLDQEGCKGQGAVSLSPSSRERPSQADLGRRVKPARQASRPSSSLPGHLLASACTLTWTEEERILPIQQELSTFVTVKEFSTYYQARSHTG